MRTLEDRRKKYQENKEELRRKALDYYAEHREQAMSSAKVWKENNKDRVKEYSRTHKQTPDQKKRYRNPERARELRLLKDYGITPDDYNRIFIDQGGYCPGCGRHQSELKKILCVDHDHETGEVRGLLCNTCNMALGLVCDNPNTLINLIRYLEKKI